MLKNCLIFYIPVGIHNVCIALEQCTERKVYYPFKALVSKYKCLLNYQSHLSSVSTGGSMWVGVVGGGGEFSEQTFI